MVDDDAPRCAGSRWVPDGGAIEEVGEGTRAGLRIIERRFSGLDDNTAVGRTGAVTGNLVVAGGAVSRGSFRVNLSKLAFTDDPGLPVAKRSEYLRTKALETDLFPEATFEFSRGIPLGALEADGRRTSVEASGILTIHGVGRTKAFRVDIERAGDEVRVVTARPVAVVLADHGIEAPKIPGVSEVAGSGEFEFLVTLTRK